MKIWNRLVYAAGILAIWAWPVFAEQIGEKDTAWKLLGPNHRMVVEVFDDPDVPGVACYVSRPKAGGIAGGLGIATERSEASIACRQVGPIDASRIGSLEPGADVFKQSTSILFKELKVARFYDGKRNVIVYLVYTTYLIDGSAHNAISTVVVRPW